MLSRDGFFTVDALAAAGILAIIIVLVSSVMYAGYVMHQQNVNCFEELQVMENHLDGLMVLDDWCTLDGVVEQVGDMSCSYVVADTAYDTIRLTVVFDAGGRERKISIERRCSHER